MDDQSVTRPSSQSLTTAPETIVLGSCKTCNGPAQLIECDGSVEYRHLSPSMDAFQSDVADLLRALGLGDHARPVAPHSVVQGEIVPAIKSLAEDLVREFAEFLATTASPKGTVQREKLQSFATEFLESRGPSSSAPQPPTIAPDGRIKCPNCAAEWYDCTHLKLASSSTPPSPELEPFCKNCGGIWSAHIRESVGLRCVPGRDSWFIPRTDTPPPSPTQETEILKLLGLMESAAKNVAWDEDAYGKHASERMRLRLKSSKEELSTAWDTLVSLYTRQREEIEQDNDLISGLIRENERLKADSLTPEEARLAIQCMPWQASDDRYPGESELLEKLRRLSSDSGTEDTK